MSNISWQLIAGKINIYRKIYLTKICNTDVAISRELQGSHC